MTEVGSNVFLCYCLNVKKDRIFVSTCVIKQKIPTFLLKNTINILLNASNYIVEFRSNYAVYLLNVAFTKSLDTANAHL